MDDIDKIIKQELIINAIDKVQNSYVVGSGIMPFIRAIPIIGDMISTSTEKALSDFQEKKQMELINGILESNELVTAEKVNDIEFIINFSKSVESVKRLATNDKVKYFGNLLKNGYLTDERIDNNDFEEFSNIINNLSYKEINYLYFIKQNSKENKISGNSMEWSKFRDAFSNEFNVSKFVVSDIFTSLKRTGFIEELYITESSEVNDNQIDEIEIDGNGYTLTSSFDRFCKFVLNII